MHMTHASSYLSRRMAAGVLLFGALAAPVFFASAQTPQTPAGNAPPANIASALNDLSRLTGQTVTTPDQARALCDQEQFLADCARIGKQHNLYSAERRTQVDGVLEELTGRIAEDLKQCRDEACIVEVATRVAQNIARTNPAVGRQLDLTPQKVAEKKAILDVGREIGVSAGQCRDTDPDTAPIELLRSCARLAKDERIQRYIPEPAKEAARTSNTTIDLREALSAGQYQCGNNTPDGCGNFCLNPSEAARAQGAAAIPAVCRDIAQRFFGSEGLQKLESAYQQVRQVEEFYRKKTEHAVFTAPNGQTLTNPEDIGQYLEDEAAKGNVEAVERGMDFMIQQGFAKPADKEFTLRIVRKVRERGGIASFEACRQNPRLCRDYIPDEQKEQFDVSDQINEVMRREIGFDPHECQRGESDHEIGRRCFEGARRALPQLEPIARKSARAAAIVEEIRGHVKEGEERTAKDTEVRASIEREGGPGGCKSENECRAYCSDPTHGPECIAFGAKKNISGFRGEEAVQRYQQFQQTFQEPIYTEAPGQDPFARPGALRIDFETRNVRTGSVEIPSPGQPPFPPYGRPGPSPECFAAIESGDFVRAKEICNTPRFLPPPPPRPVCPLIFPLPCQEGQYRPEQRDSQNNCPGFGACVAIPGYKPDKQILCPALYSVDSCPAGQQRVISFSSPECGAYYGCEEIKSKPPICPALPTVDSCPTGQHKTVNFSSPECGTYYGCTPDTQTVSYPYTFSDGKVIKNYEEARAYCNQYGPGSGRGISAECQSKFGIIYGQTCASGQYWFVPPEGGAGYCRSNTEPVPGDSACQELESLIPGCHTMFESPNARFNTGMTQYVIVGTRAVKSCAAEKIPGCSGTSSTSDGSSYCQELESLIPGCHTMSESPNARFDTSMTRYVIVGTRTVKNCATERIPGCSGGGGSTYPGDANSCPGFAYSRYDSANKRYCQLNTTRACDYNYPSYLTNGANYKPENCPASDGTGTTPGTGCGQYTTQATCPSQSCVWNSSACGPIGTGGGGSCGGYASQSTCVAASNCQWNAPTGFPAYCSMTYAGDSGSCPGFAYSKYDSTNKRYCQLNTAFACEYNYPDYLRVENYSAADCSSPLVTGQTSCSDGRDNDGDGRIDYPADAGCYSAADDSESFPCPSGYRALESTTREGLNHCQSTTNSTQCQQPGGSTTSYTCPTQTTSTGTTAAGSPSAPSVLSASIASNNTDVNLVWNDTSANETEFKVWRRAGTSGWAFLTSVSASATGPSTGTIRHTDPNVPSGTAEYMVQACSSAGCSADSNLSSVTIGGSTTTTPPPGTTACSDGRDNDGDGLIDYPADTGCYGREDNDETPGTAPTTGTAQCSDGRDNDGDGQIDYPADTGCYGRDDNDEAYAPTTTSSSCPSFAHEMSGYCMLNNDATRCAEYSNASSESAYTSAVCQQRSGATSTGGGSCPSGQYWTGSACATSASGTGTACTAGQYWNGTACVTSGSTSGCSTPGNCYDSSICASSGWYWYNGGCWSSPQSTGATTCSSGQYWNGTSCVSSSSTSGSGAVCGNGSCESAESAASCPADCGSYTPPPSTTTTTCSSGQYWNGSACVSSETTSTPPPSTSTTPTCPSGQTWNGSTCAGAYNRSAHFFAQILTTARWFIHGFKLP